MFGACNPQPDGEPSFRTEFRVAYDDRSLYVFVRAYDPHPDSIMRALSRRDVRGPSDQIVVFIDSYNDRRTGFQFGVNPDGVKRDYAVYNDTNEDGSWNAVWEVATVVDSLGWTAEFRIPLSQLRYADAARHDFGFGVFREIERYKERVAWPLFSRNVNGTASQMGTLSGIVGISSSRSVELTPYSVVQSETRAAAGGGFEQAVRVVPGAERLAVDGKEIIARLHADARHSERRVEIGVPGIAFVDFLDADKPAGLLEVGSEQADRDALHFGQVAAARVGVANGDFAAEEFQQLGGQDMADAGAFDVAGLAALRIEDPAVFQASRGWVHRARAPPPDPPR